MNKREYICNLNDNVKNLIESDIYTYITTDKEDIDCAMNSTIEDLEDTFRVIIDEIFVELEDAKENALDFDRETSLILLTNPEKFDNEIDGRAAIKSMHEARKNTLQAKINFYTALVR